MKKNILALFLDRLMTFPMWVKQIIYLRLYQNMSEFLSEDFIKINEADIFHLYKPTLSFIGETELCERKAGLDENMYNFLKNVQEGLSMLEISMNNFWTMEEVAKYYIFCLEQNYVKTAQSIMVYAMAGFMAGKFRTGEYFKRSGKINVDQLEKVIERQKILQEQGKGLKIAEIMIEMGLVTEKDTKSLLLLKEEAKNRFILDTSILPSQVNKAVDNFKNEHEELEKLREQNKLLKAQLAKILAFLKKNG